MANYIADASLNRTARVAGILYLLIAVFAPFSMVYVPSMLIVPGDAATTASNVLASEGLFRLGIASDSIVFLIEIVRIAVTVGCTWCSEPERHSAGGGDVVA